MLVERWREIETLYHSACERKPEERRTYLERACVLRAGSPPQTFREILTSGNFEIPAAQ